jgi:hypothetical protein
MMEAKAFRAFITVITLYLALQVGGISNETVK